MKADYEQIDQLVTREQILNMKAGAELDALIAEHMMGYKLIECCGNKYIDAYLSRVIPRYSTDISAAWEVIEKINQIPWKMQRSYKDRWQVGRLGYCVAWCEENLCDDKDKVCSWCECGKVVWAEMAPEAICKAALLATLEVEGNA